MSRERAWRGALVDAIAPAADDTIVDVGAGTGSMAVAIKARAPSCRLIAIDPDPAVLAIAQAKAKNIAGIEWRQGMGDRIDAHVANGTANKVVSSLVLHHCDAAMKAGVLRAIWKVLRPGGQLFIADYGVQRSMLLRGLFLLVQAVDGFGTTGENLRGLVPALIAETGFVDVTEQTVVPTPTGSVSLYTASKPA